MKISEIEEEINKIETKKGWPKWENLSLLKQIIKKD